MKTFTSILIVVLITFSKSYPQNFWEKTTGPDTLSVYSLAINLDGDIFAGTSNGIFRSTNNGESWSNIGLQDYKIQAIITQTNGEILIGVDDYFAGGGIYRSTDNGNTWTIFGIPERPISSILIDLNGDIFAGTNHSGIFRSLDNGENWVQINNGLTDLHPTSLIINTMGAILAGTMFGGTFRSMDRGENWVQINQGLTYNYALSLTINSIGDIFAGTSGSGIFRSTNNGENWNEINQGLGGESFWIFSIEINSDGVIFIGTADGVFRSIDNGENWVQINEGLVNLAVRSLGINSDHNIFAGTSGGIFKRSTEITSIDNTDTEIISSFELYQNYPNPFNPATKISWQSAVDSRQILKIFDVLGNEVATIVDEYKAAGRYEINFDASGLSSGIYFYQLNTGDFISMKKMILLK